MMRSAYFMVLSAPFIFSSCSQKNSDPATQTPNEPAPSSQASAIYPVPIDGLPVMGASDALVTIVELTDYDCPFCARAEHTIHALREKYGRDIRVAVAEHPLPMHPRARDAALAALAIDEA